MSFSLQNTDPSNIEEIFYDFFDTTTPENRFLSQLLVKNLNLLAEKKMRLLDFKNLISVIQRTSADNRQLDMLEGINKIADRIVNKMPE